MSWLSPLRIYLLWRVFKSSICSNCLFGMVYLFSWYICLANPQKHIWQIWSHKVMKWKHNFSLKCLFLNWLDSKTNVGHHYFKECSFENNEYLEKCLGGGLSCEVDFDVMGFSPLVQKQMLVILCFRMIDKLLNVQFWSMDCDWRLSAKTFSTYPVSLVSFVSCCSLFSSAVFFFVSCCSSSSLAAYLNNWKNHVASLLFKIILAN